MKAICLGLILLLLGCHPIARQLVKVQASSPIEHPEKVAVVVSYEVELH